MADGAQIDNPNIPRFERLVAIAPERALYCYFDLYPELSLNRLLHCCLYLKEAGHLDLANRAVNLLLEEDPPSPWACYEGGIVRELMGDRDGALGLFTRAFELRPELSEALVRKIVILSDRGDREAVATILGSPAAREIPAQQRAFLQAFNDPDNPWREHFDTLDQPSKPVIDFAGAAAMAHQALDNGEAFSLVRLGDGEGAFLIPDDDDDLAGLGAQARRYFAGRWYGRSDDATLAAIERFMEGMPQAVMAADIVARPNPEWCRYEWANGNLMTLAACLGASLYAQTLGRTLAGTSVALDMCYAGALAQLVRKAPSVCLVTCHPDLARRMAAVTGEDKFSTIVVPPAHSDLDITGLGSRQNHLERAPAILESIDAAKGTRLFLVGAGILGKLYTHHARLGGAVAIDVGSVLDGILDLDTRPNFHSIDLPPRFWDVLAGAEPLVE